MNYLAANSPHELFRRIPQKTVTHIGRHIKAWAKAHNLTYTDERGKTTTITLTLRPRLIPENMRDECWRILRVLDGSFKKLAPLYFRHPRVAELFPFSPREEEWLSVMQEPAYRPGQIASRWDSNTTFGARDWKKGFSFFEVNGVGVGGMWYGPACADLAMKKIVPELQKVDPRFRPVWNHDMRRLLLQLLLSQRQRLGRTRGCVALVMEKASGSNFIEFVSLARLYNKLGYPTLVAEPTDLVWRRQEVFARNKRIDILYRDTTLSELCSLEGEGHDLTAFREAFRRGQVVSSLEGEWDHKSAFEVFTNPEFSKFFTARERLVFHQYVLWTRLVREATTPDPCGKVVDLIPFVLKKQSQLVLKPNRLYGGKGVVIGREVRRSVWQAGVETALRETGDWVIQQLGEFRTKRFFRADEKGVRAKDLYVVSGFFATEKGLGIVGRMSERKVVNVAQRGGLTPILLVR